MAVGAEMLKSALQGPARQIIANAGLEGAVVLMKVKEGTGSFGFNARTEEYQDLKAIIAGEKISKY